MKNLMAAIAAMTMLVPTVEAQVVAPVAPPPDSATMLATGTPITLRTTQELTTRGRRLRVGQQFALEVADAVSVNGRVIIPAGTPAVGEVIQVRNKGMWGKSGHLTAQLRYVSLDGRQIRLTGTFDDKGTTGTAGVVGAALFFAPAGFFLTGTSARIPAGSSVAGTIGEDVPLDGAALAAAR